MSVNVIQTYRARPTNPIHHPPIALSNFDEYIPKIYTSSHYFFENVDNKEGFMDHRKLFSSLEDILVDYYPLAGRLKIEPDGRLSILYSDQGVPFIIAECLDVTIKQLEEKNWVNESIPNGLLPVSNKAEPDGPLLAVQHTTLGDGSVVLGVSVHHSVTDGSGTYSFIENWGRKARRESFTLPVHNRSLLKASGSPPSREHPEFMVFNPPQNITKNTNSKVRVRVQLPKIIRKIFYFSFTNKTNSKVQVQLPQVARKIFYFSKENLKKLHDAYSSDDPTDSWISTNDALVAHICRAVARARGIPLDEKITCPFACDIRKKVNPPLPPSYFGNAVLSGHPKILVSELINGPRSKIALNIRKELTEIDDEKVRSALDWLRQQPNISKIIPNINFKKDFFVTNWSKFPMYSLDFGYGTPVKYRSVRDSSIAGAAILIGTPANDGGIEMYINLSPEHMRNLEQDPEFRMFQ